MKYNVRQDLSIFEDEIESLFIEVQFEHKKNKIIGIIYRPPNNNHKKFSECLSKILSTFAKENKNCHIMGDFNIDLLKK